MKLDEFVKQPRGPYLFDWFLHPVRLGSPIGEFHVELAVEMDGSPTPEMVSQAIELAAHFERDKEIVAQLVHDEYKRACTDPGWGPDWMESCKVPIDLPMERLEPYLDPRSISVDSERGLVYLGPDSDREHGLYFIYDGSCWVKTDPLGRPE